MSESVWRTIDSAPEDGTHFLAWCVCVADELDEDDRIIAKDVIEEYAVVAYGWRPGAGFVTFPWRGSVPVNVKYTHWQPLPEPPKAE